MVAFNNPMFSLEVYVLSNYIDVNESVCKFNTKMSKKEIESFLERIVSDVDPHFSMEAFSLLRMQKNLSFFIKFLN
jgi:hypothetical protein